MPVNLGECHISITAEEHDTICKKMTQTQIKHSKTRTAAETSKFLPDYKKRTATTQYSENI